MAKINPDWLAAEQERLEAEAEYTTAREKWQEDVQRLNAKIEAANQKVRQHKQYLD